MLELPIKKQKRNKKIILVDNYKLPVFKYHDIKSIFQLIVDRRLFPTPEKLKEHLKKSKREINKIIKSFNDLNLTFPEIGKGIKFCKLSKTSLLKNINSFFRNNEDFVGKVANEMNIRQKSKNLALYTTKDIKTILNDLFLKHYMTEEHSLLFFHITVASFFIALVDACRHQCDSDLFGQELFQNDAEYELDD